MHLEVDVVAVPVAALAPTPDSGKVNFCSWEEKSSKSVHTEVDVGERLGHSHNGTGRTTDFESHFERRDTANSFTWVKFKPGSGPHTVEVKADIEESVGPGGSTASIEAVIGPRTVLVTVEKVE